MSDTLKLAQKLAEVATERAKVVQRLEELDVELGSLLGGTSTVKKVAAKTAEAVRPAATAAVVATTGKKRRGRPKGSKNKPATGRKRGRPKTSDKPESDVKVAVNGSEMELPDLLTTIAQEVGKPMKLPDFLSVVLSSGYQSDAKDKSNMVYQALNKLVKRGTLKKDPDSREYVIADAA
jgi:hypothetical protein